MKWRLVAVVAIVAGLLAAYGSLGIMGRLRDLRHRYIDGRDGLGLFQIGTRSS